MFYTPFPVTQLNRKRIDLSQICYGSTCITLNIIQSLACSICEPKIDIHTRKGGKN